MKHYLFWLTIFLPMLSRAAPDVWLRSPPPSLGVWSHWTPLPRDSFFEVPVSRLSAAEAYLANATFRPEGPSGITYFGRSDFACAGSAKPYLIRAIYMQGGTGAFQLYWKDGTLVVSHGGLGMTVAIRRSALVACLPHAPEVVFGAATTAQ